MSYLWLFLFAVNLLASFLPETGTWVDYFNVVFSMVALILFCIELRKEARIRKQRREAELALSTHLFHKKLEGIE